MSQLLIMKFFKFKIVLFFLGICNCFSQSTDYPQYAPPMKIDLYAAGVFGELRKHHFHTGIDLKTQQRQGIAVRAVADGFVSRVLIREASYGKAIYLSHPDGYTSVYAHLKDFSKRINAYVKKEQYKKKSYLVDMAIPRKLIKVKKNNIIGISGNTGSSTAPHLHFEMRKTIDQTPLNPMLFGIKIADTIPPIVRSLFGYPIDKKSQINGSEIPVKINFNRISENLLLADPINASGDIGFGIISYDRQNGGRNKNGLYQVSLSVNGQEILSYNFNEIDFDKSYFINTFIDYAHYVKTREKEVIQKCFISPGNGLNIYSKNINQGVISIKEDLSYNVVIALSDFINNETKLIIPIIGKSMDIVTYRPSKDGSEILTSKDYYFIKDNRQVYFPRETFYKNQIIKIEPHPKSIDVGINTIPVKNQYRISFDISNYPKEIKDQLFVAYKNRKKFIYQKSKRRKNTLVSTTKVLGNFSIMRDSIPPSVKNHNFQNQQTLESQKRLAFKISDDLSGIDRYDVTINNRWILAEYEYKKNLLTCDLDDLKSSEKILKIEINVTDRVGNNSNLKTTVYR